MYAMDYMLSSCCPMWTFEMHCRTEVLQSVLRFVLQPLVVDEL